MAQKVEIDRKTQIFWCVMVDMDQAELPSSDARERQSQCFQTFALAGGLSGRG